MKYYISKDGKVSMKPDDPAVNKGVDSDKLRMPKVEVKQAEQKVEEKK